MISETYRRVKRKDGVICFRDLKRWRGKTRGGEGERVRGAVIGEGGFYLKQSFFQLLPY